MRQCGPVNVIVYAPNTENGQKELSGRIASIHADAVISRIHHLPCPATQKLQLLDSIIARCKYPLR